jgi:signal transduction histidine kinase
METRQVLLNLVRNAVEATARSGAHVIVSLEGRAEDVRVVVSDEGSGMTPPVMATLFQFGASTKGEGGNGMGLWLVKQLVGRHGGAIDVESDPEKGSRFTVIWPRKIPATAAGNATVQAVSQLSAQTP